MLTIETYTEAVEQGLFIRDTGSLDVSAPVSEIIAEVRARGDDALREYSRKFDRAAWDTVEISRDEWDDAVAAVPAEMVDRLSRARDNIAAFHRCQIREGFTIAPQDGVVLGQLVIPLARVGLYIPGGTAAYPSSVLMNAVPARLAGVGEIIMCTPATGGAVNPAVLAAARLAGVDRVFRVGGAQAVAAMAYGTASVPAVDKIVGPGNAYVAEAKRQVFGKVAIDMIAGPSEILVVADGGSDPAVVAADLLSQAEHDTQATAVLVTDSRVLAHAVALEVERQLAALPRAEIARQSIDGRGKIVIAESLEQAVEIANRLAPEHLELMVERPFDLLPKVRNAGSVFLGRSCPEALGDYWAGPNHTLPTLGTARFSSPLSVDDFVKRSSFTYYTASALSGAAADVAALARLEGLEAHARSALSRLAPEGGEA